MFNFHKPRVYRSTDGCCICRAKSSSSRFTASRKYEKESIQCFNLNEPRNGEICNACVLLVKRYKRLPVGSKRHWGHVVDARAGPGTKSLAKQKKRENESGDGGGGGSSLTEKFAKILKKNRKVKTTTTATTTNGAMSPSGDQQQQQQQLLLLKAQSMRTEEQPSDSNESNDEEQQLQQQQQQLMTTATTTSVAATAAMPYQTRKRTAAAALATTTTTTTPTSMTATIDKMRLTGSKRRRILQPMKHRRAIDNVPFFEAHDLLRLDVCCGTVFQSLSLGSACFIIDTDLYKPCEKHRRRGGRQEQPEQQEQQQQPVLQPQQQQQQQQQTVALKKHHLYFKRQSESFPQGDIHRISPIPISLPIPMQKTEPLTTTTTKTTTNLQQQHSTDDNLALMLKSTAETTTTTATSSSSAAAATSSSSSAALNASLLTTAAAATTTTTTTTAVGAASPSSLSSSSNCSTSSSVATKFNDNSSDSGFDEHVLDRKSVSPPTQDELQLDNKKLRVGGMQRLILASGLPISGQTQNLVLTGNEFTARFVQRQQQQTSTLTATQPLKITAAAAAAAGATASTLTGSQNSGNCNKMQMRAIFNNANLIQHENGVTTILPASSIAASNQTAAMNAIAPSTVTITPAKINSNINNINNPIANNPKFILLKPTIGKTPTEVKIA